MVEVVRGEVGGSPVIPERHTARCPAEAHRIFGTEQLVEQVLEDSAAFQRRYIHDVVDEPRVNEQGALASSGVNADHGMDSDQAVLFDPVSVLVCDLGQALPVGPVTVLRSVLTKAWTGSDSPS